MTKALRPLLSVTLLAGLAWTTDWAQVGRAFANLHLELWLAAVGLLASAQVVSGWRWQLIARLLGFERPLWQYTGFYFIGMFFNAVLPISVGGDVIRACYLAGGSGRRLAAFASVFLDRFSGLVVLLALAGGAALSCPFPLPAWVHACVCCAAGGAVAGVAGLVLLQKLPWAPRNRRLAHLHYALGQLQTALVSRPGLLLGTTCLSLVVQAVNVALVWLVGLAIAAPVPAHYYWLLVPMVTLLTLLPVSVNGMGVREGGMILFLAPLGVPEGTALTLALLWFAVFTAASLCGGLVYLFGRFPRPGGETGFLDPQRGEHGPVRGDPDQGRTRQPAQAA